uniref:Uncharacterized protein n=1 Tax=Anguilla anguilla TaxID=7936 RepID=A0A0E9P7M8_ANGAN
MILNCRHSGRLVMAYSFNILCILPSGPTLKLQKLSSLLKSYDNHATILVFKPTTFRKQMCFAVESIFC